MNNALLVFLGAGLGGVARYGVGQMMFRPAITFPWPTLLVNVSGSFLITLIVGLMGSRGLAPQWQAFLMVGLCGGYTTFSAFSYETLALIHAGHWQRAGAYVVASVVLCLVAALLGLRMGSAL